VHSGFTEDQIDNFGYQHYQGCIIELYRKFNFDGIKSIMGNAYAKDGWKAVTEANPMNIEDTKTKTKPKPTLNMMKNFGLI
jgi:hypothetical protein